MRRSGNEEQPVSNRQMTDKKGDVLKVQPFMFSGAFKAPCMTACASSFLVLRASMVSLSSNSSVSYEHIAGS